ncbi:hypothetical protein KL930_000544 [Ogataea haglerorum]|nr:hypothetical protein KL951_004553 [Ogataea haglerorum]KAG7771098.1 hypothetical protein KL931_000796 [Ogataea haglerorum]KAG7777645.1 hypothetical protein KL922_003035 [Ogataea haglerorum]KAG7783210.1 hypothetical protein KL930_000544 [Ogataea haglerorum]KAG7787214.1 hypothetical protein KL910_003876 [Ogataea haglerorum]
MAYEQRKLLEQLMGRDALVKLPRDYDVRRVQSIDPSVLASPKVCKSFLVGKCPYDLFQGTKEDRGKCPKIHQEKLKILYETCVKNGVRMPNDNYKLDYIRDLEGVINECNRKIRVAEKRLELSGEEKEKLSSVTQELDKLDEQVSLMLQEISLLADKGELEMALDWNKELEQVIRKRDAVATQYTEMVENINQSAQQKLQVCEQCGAYLSRLDNDRRLADHFVGKMHLAYVEMRRALAELKGR